MARRSTMRDVSQATGFSMFTVSQALSGAEGVADASREQVLTAARDLGYVQNRAAKALRKTPRDSIAVITADTANSYYLAMLGGIQAVLRPPHWSIVVADVATDGVYSAALEDRTVRRLIESRTAGIVSALTLSPENTRLLAYWDIPVVFVDSTPPEGASDFPRVGTDNYNSSLLVGAHLAQHGYKDWLFLVYPSVWSTRIERERGIRDAADRHGARIVVVESENDAASAYFALAARLDAGQQLPNVLIAGNNPMLLGALKLLRDRKIQVPSDIALVSFDEFAWASLLDPPVTVLNEHSEHIGTLAAKTLAEIIQGQAEREKNGQSPTPVYRPDYQQLVAADLIVRASCGCGLLTPPGGRSGRQRSG